MKKIYSIGYIDMYGDFQKFKDRNGYTVKYATIEECKEIIERQSRKTLFKIMQGWDVLEIIDKREA